MMRHSICLGVCALAMALAAVRVAAQREPWGEALRLDTLQRDASGMRPILLLPGNALGVAVGYSEQVVPSSAVLPWQGQRQQQASAEARGLHRAQRWFAHGEACYSYSWIANRYGVILDDAWAFYPYITLDSIARRQQREGYRLGGTLAYQWGTFALGIGAHFSASTRFSLQDPRPRARASRLQISIPMGGRVGEYALSFAPSWTYYQEKLSVRMEQTKATFTLFYQLGFGRYDSYASLPQSSAALTYHAQQWRAELHADTYRCFWPTVKAWVERRSAHPETHELPKANRTFSWLYGIEVDEHIKPFHGALMQLSLGYTGELRKGFELHYSNELVYEDPDIYEWQQFGETFKWRGIHHCARGRLALQVGLPLEAKLGFAYAARFEAYRSGYSSPRGAAQLTRFAHWVEGTYSVPLGRWRLAGSVEGGYSSALRQSLVGLNLAPSYAFYFTQGWRGAGASLWGCGGGVRVECTLKGVHRVGIAARGGATRSLQEGSAAPYFSVSLLYALRSALGIKGSDE